MHATRVLRTAELRTAVALTLELGSRLVRLDQLAADAPQRMTDLGNSWLETQQKVFGLVRGVGIPPAHSRFRRLFSGKPVEPVPEVAAFRRAMKAATIEMRVAVGASEDRRGWSSYKMAVLKKKLHAYGETAEVMLRIADDEVLNGQGSAR